MKTWPKVAWSDAGQVLALMEAEPAPPGEGVAAPSAEPHAYFESLVKAGQLREAAQFVGQALPRYEGIVWAVQTLLAGGGLDRSNPLVTAILRWMDNPSDERRREVYALSEQAKNDDPARMLGIAVFLSGGSISEPDLPPVLAPDGASGKLASAAVIVAAYKGEQPNSLLNQAIEVGRQSASQGA